MKTDWQTVHSKIQEKRKKVTFSTMQIIAFGFLGVILIGSILELLCVRFCLGISLVLF
jgi:trk system potassium uptake protein TrkH